MIEVFEKFSQGHGNLFKQIIIFNNFKNIVEIGVAVGTTTKYLCEAAQITGGYVKGFDCWSTHGKWNQFGALSTKDNVENYLHQHNLKNFELYQVDTKSDEFTKIISQFHNIDFTFIDGDHSYDGIKNDFDIIYPLLSEMGIIVFHDTLKIDGCREFIIDLRTKYYDGTYDIIDFPWGNDERRVGISLLVKRSYPIINIEIDEKCGSVSNFEEIYQKEKNWYKNELIKYEKNNIS